MGKGWLIVIAALVLACLCLGCVVAGWWYVTTQGGVGELARFLEPTPDPAEATATAGGTLRLVGGKPVTLDPALIEDATSAEYMDKLFVGLVSLDDALLVRPELAERWTVSADGRIYTFTLRDNARFADGRLVTADDVKYSLERACAPETGSSVAETYLGDIVGAAERLAGKAKDIAGVKVLDERTLQITIDAPKSYFLAKLTYSTAAVVDRRNVEGKADWLKAPNGAGPYRLTRQSSDEIVLQASEYYFRGKPAIETIQYLMPAGDPVTMYETGELDATPVGIDDFERVQDPTNPLHLELIEVPSLNVQYVGLNARMAPFDDVKVRQAFAYAVNRQAIVDILLKKSARQARGILPPGLPGYNEKLAGLEYNPARARQLLRESRYGAADKLPPIVFVVSIGNTEMAEALSAMFEAALGVKVEIQQVEWRYFLRDLGLSRYAMYSLGWSADYPDPQNFLDIQFHSASSSNYAGYRNSQVDALLEKAGIERDDRARMALYQQAEEIIVSEAPWIPIYHGVDYMLVKPYVKGFSITPQGMYNVERAYVEKP
jgi:ABC-type transport system substrate-binding protein